MIVNGFGPSPALDCLCVTHKHRINLHHQNFVDSLFWIFDMIMWSNIPLTSPDGAVALLPCDPSPCLSTPSWLSVILSMISLMSEGWTMNVWTCDERSIGSHVHRSMLRVNQYSIRGVSRSHQGPKYMSSVYSVLLSDSWTHLTNYPSPGGKTCWKIDNMSMTSPV